MVQPACWIEEDGIHYFEYDDLDILKWTKECMSIPKYRLKFLLTNAKAVVNVW